MEDVYYKGSIPEGSADAMKDDKPLVFFVAGLSDLALITEEGS